ncbi:MAG: lytic transglycosylase domain-containing protein [Solirubrobacteraceae bacterium]
MRSARALALGRRAAISIAGIALVAVLGLLLLGGAAIALVAGGPSEAAAPAGQAAVSALARSEIPLLYLHLYIAAASRYGIDWAILAGIGKVECDHGRNPSPSCTNEGAENAAGAGGPMQFLASTWAQYGVAVDGGRPDRWNPADAIYSAANYLRASGAPGDYRDAIYAYNHALWYVQEVEYWAARYRGLGAGVETIAAAQEATDGVGQRAISQQASDTPVLYVPGDQAKLLRGDGHVALIPEAAPPAVQAMIVAGNELQDLPYGPTGHPDPLGASSEDCSSTVNYVLYRAGVRSLAEIVRENPLAQDYVHWGASGPGRWVSVYATDTPQPHVFMTIAGLRLDTVGGSTDEGPNSSQEGPRWRVLQFIPTWAHWSVRHPPGL